MVMAAAWALVVLGVGHIVTGLVWFRSPLLDAARGGIVGQFKQTEARRLAFWFLIFGPMVAMAGHIALHAVSTQDASLLKMLGFYLLAVAGLGIIAVPRSPFWLAALISPVLIAAGYGWPGR